MNFDDYTKDMLRTNSLYKEELRKYEAGEEMMLNMMDNSVFGLAGETGEIIEHLKKWKFQGHKLNKEKIKDELGDLLWYISEMMFVLGLNLDEILEYNVEKRRKRYPKGFSTENSINK